MCHRFDKQFRYRGEKGARKGTENGCRGSRADVGILQLFRSLELFFHRLNLDDKSPALSFVVLPSHPLASLQIHHFISFYFIFLFPSDTAEEKSAAISLDLRVTAVN